MGESLRDNIEREEERGGMRSINMDFAKFNIEKGDREEQSEYSCDGVFLATTH